METSEQKKCDACVYSNMVQTRLRGAFVWVGTFVLVLALWWTFRKHVSETRKKMHPPLYHKSEEPLMQQHPRFLTTEECKHLVDLSRFRLEEAQVGMTHPQASSKVRNNRVCFLRENTDAVTRSIVARIETLLGIPRSHFEDIQVGHYRSGEYYKRHADDALETPDNPRCHTVLMYLNDVEKGGETHFPKYNLKIKPEQGHAVVFRPVEYDAEKRGFRVVDKLEHEALAPVGSDKWIATVWVRFFPRT